MRRRVSIPGARDLMNDVLQAISQRQGTPCFVYFLDHITERIGMLREAFDGRFALSYAVKSNPHIEMLRWLRIRVDLLDISSAGELRRAMKAGWPAARISFTGPGKQLWELEDAVKCHIGEIIVESVAEARMLDEVSRKLGTRVPILIRIGPKRVPRGFGGNMSGKPSQFGIDEEDMDAALSDIVAMRHLDLVGFHVYSGTQCLNADSIAENYEIYIELFRRFAGARTVLPRKLVFGSGLGIPYHEQERPLDLAHVARRINPQLDALKAEPRFAGAVLVLELGRYLVGEAGIYLTRVIGKKRSRGVEICVCDGGMHHHLAACGHFGTVVHRNYRMFRVTPAPSDATVAEHELVGPLCTPIDALGHRVKLPALSVGDVVAIECSGAYGPSASPVNFISHPPAKEIAVETRGGSLVVTDISQGEPIRLP